MRKYLVRELAFLSQNLFSEENMSFIYNAILKDGVLFK